MSDYPRTLLEFQHLFPDKTARARHLERIPPEGFECPSCGQVGDPWRRQARLRVLECRPIGGAGLQGLLRRHVGTYEFRGIRRACANRIGM